MDQKLLDALSNLSDSLEAISEALKDKSKVTSDTASALKSGNFSETLREINVSLKSIKSDTKEILKQQKTILELSKKKQSGKTDAFESDPKKESSIKKGVTSILLIAAGVLAIGLAFKLVGKVDFLSVIGLGVGIYAVSVAFEKIGGLKNLSYGKVLMISSVMPLMGMGIWLASKFLSRVSPMSLGQIITSIGIAGAFYFIAPVITSMMDAMMNSKEVTLPGGKKIKTSKFDINRLKGTIVALPILMLGMALGITVSSWVLAAVRPMGLGQIITAVAIAGMFAIAAMGIKGMIHALTEENEVKGKGGFRTKTMDMSKLSKIATFLPIVMLAIAVGITVSSWVLGLVRPMGLGQAITAILIAGMFAVVSWGIGTMLTALSKIKSSDLIKDAMMLPILLPALALAITVSSWVLSLVIPISLAQFLTGIAISVMFIAFAATLAVLNKGGVLGKIGMKDIVKIPLIFIALSIAITVSSWVLSLASEISFGRSLEILAFSVVLCVAVIAVALTSVLITKLGGTETFIKGAIAIVVIAATIMISSQILNLGNYSKYPSWKWSLSVALSLALFGVGAVLLGAEAMSPTFYAGLGAVLLVAVTVVAASHILAMGNYKKYPTVAWGKGVGLALAAFGVGAVLLGTQVLNPFFYGGLGEILLVAGTVVAASHILNKGDYKKYPTVAWGKGVGLAFSEFAIGAVLLGFQVLNPLFYPGLKKIEEVAFSIVRVSHILNRGDYSNINKEWVSGVRSALSIFNGFVGRADDIAYATHMIVDSIKYVAISFSDKRINWNAYPPKEWSHSVYASMIRYVNTINAISGELTYLSLFDMQFTLNSMITTAKKLTKNAKYFEAVINPDFVKNLSGNILPYVDMINIASDRLIYDSLFDIQFILDSMITSSKKFSKNAKYFEANINPNFMKNLSSNILYYIALTNKIQKQQTLGSFVKRIFFGDPISNVADGMVKLAKAYDRLAKSLTNLNSSMKNLDEKKLNQFRGLTGNIAVLSALDSRMFDNMLRVLETRSGVFAKLLEQQVPKKGTVSRASVGGKDKKSVGKPEHKKGKYGDQNRQLDIMIELLARLLGNISEGSSLDELIQRKLSEKESKK